MVNKLRRKFVFVATISVCCMLFVVVIGASIWNYVDLNQRTDQLVHFIADNGGVLPKPGKKPNPDTFTDLPREASFDTRYFLVYLSATEQIVATDTTNIYATSSQQAQQYAQTVLDQQQTTGFIDGYKFLRTTLNGSDSIIFVDASRDVDILKNFIVTSSVLSLVALCLVAVIAYLLSPFAIRPIIEAYEKQKRFITDASHELKTPLTVISANLDIIEMGSGESKWTKNSKDQVTRLAQLVNSLVALSRMDEAQTLARAPFDFSQLCEMVTESYESLALSEHKPFVAEIKPDIIYDGNEQAISQLCYILLDNAFKYTPTDGEIHLSLTKKHEKVVLRLTNAVEQIAIGKHPEFFDRFYRHDESRNSQTGGFGIGLALAKAIVRKHKGKISATSLDGTSVTIEVILP
ncbi:MAG: sensor histidine kinase [Culicoidibacterales bacterium]